MPLPRFPTKKGHLICAFPIYTTAYFRHPKWIRPPMTSIESLDYMHASIYATLSLLCPRVGVERNVTPFSTSFMHNGSQTNSIVFVSHAVMIIYSLSDSLSNNDLNAIFRAYSSLWTFSCVIRRKNGLHFFVVGSETQFAVKLKWITEIRSKLLV